MAWGEFDLGLFGYYSEDGSFGWIPSASFWATDRVVIDGVPVPLGTFPQNFYPSYSIMESFGGWSWSVLDWYKNRRMGNSVRCTRD